MRDAEGRLWFCERDLHGELVAAGNLTEIRGDDAMDDLTERETAVLVFFARQKAAQADEDFNVLDLVGPDGRNIREYTFAEVEMLGDELVKLRKKLQRDEIFKFVEKLARLH